MLQACPYKIEVWAEDSNVDLKPAGLEPGGRALEAAIIEATKGKVSNVDLKPGDALSRQPSLKPP